MRGEVKEVEEAAGTALVGVGAKNAWGDHVTGAVTVALPR